MPADRFTFGCGCSWPIIRTRERGLPDLDFDIDLAPYECPAVWEMLSRGDVKGVFQLESPLGRQWAKKLRPDRIEHMGALGALLRPGCLNSVDSEGISIAEHYARRKNGEEPVTETHPDVDPILGGTYNLMLYQEQSMALASTIAGFSPGEVDALRKGIGKKDQALLAKLGKQFLDGCERTGKVGKDVAEMVWGWIRETGRYQFNASHAFSYGIRGWKTAYAKQHFSVAFFTGWLRHAKLKMDPRKEIRELVDEARLFQVPILPPDFRDLRSDVWTDRENVHFGLGNIKGVGPAAVTRMEREKERAEKRAGKPVKDWSWEDFLMWHGLLLSHSAACRLAEAGALSFSGLPRQRMLAELANWERLTEKEQEFARTLPAGPLTTILMKVGRPKKDGGGCHTAKRAEAVLGLAAMLENPPSPLVDTPGWIAAKEEELLGAGLTMTMAEAVDSDSAARANATCYEAATGRLGTLTIAAQVRSAREVLVKRGKQAGSKMAFLSLADSTAAINDVTVFAGDWEKLSSILREGAACVVQGERDKRGSWVVKKAWAAKAL